MKNFNLDINGSALNEVATDVLKPVGVNRNFIVWMSFLGMALIPCIYAYYIQLQEGLIVTGLRDLVSWGMYIANFVFFVATSLVGMLISSVLGLIGFKWVKPITRIAEIIAVAFAAIAGIVIISDMGRPDRLHHILMHGRVQSPIVWDITVVNTYFFLSLLLYFLPLIPDLAIAKGRLKNPPLWLVKAYEILSFKWTHHPEQYKLLFKGVRVLLVLIIPTAFAIHTVTSWLFAVTPRAGWDSTIFGPYFITGAFVAGSAAVVIAMFIFRKIYKLENYLSDHVFDMMGKLLVLVALIYLYFNLNEFLVPAYKMKEADATHIMHLVAGEYAPMFWFVQIAGLILPIILLTLPKMRKPLPIAIISAFVLIASWFKRYLIVIPTMAHPFLPVQQGLPDDYIHYQPTLIENFVTLGSFILALMVMSVLAKLFPVIPIWEIAEEKQNEVKTTEQ